MIPNHWEGIFYRDIFCMMIVSYGMIVISMPMNSIHCKHNPKCWSVRIVILVCVFLKDKINTCNQFSPKIIFCLQKSGMNTNRIGINFYVRHVYFPKYHLSLDKFLELCSIPVKKIYCFLLDYLLPLVNKCCFCMNFLSYAINDLDT